jgi:hypothetical protein
VLSAFDDYPIHQASLPVALTASSDPNHYDRYFFNGYRRDASLYFAAAMGLYPNRHVADAAFSVVVGGEQINVHASRRAPEDRAEATVVGPIRVEVLEGLKTLRLTVEAPEHGLRADLRFEHRTVAVEEPHFFRRAGQRVVFDYTRLTQFGTWTGWLEVDGQRHEVNPDQYWGSRDRSWGIRPVGERYGYGAPAGPAQFYWLWAPVNFEGFCTHFDVSEDASGSRWHQEALIVNVGESMPVGADQVDYRLTWRPGTRHAAACEIDFLHGGGVSTLSLEPILEFQMLGIGYGHPDWGHGVWKGESVSGGDRWALPVSTPLAPHHLHVQALSRATLRDPSGRLHEGMGILEQLVIGPHAPSGFADLLDGAP